jgi:hypothetical protein
VVARSTFETPGIEELLVPAAAYVVPSAGGLYVARRGDVATAVIVPPSVRQLADLGCVPRIDDRERSPDSVLRVVRSAGVWARARLTGDLFSAIRQREVLHALTLHAVRLVGGETWASAELAARAHDDGFAALKAAVSKHSDEAAIAAVLDTELAALATATCAARVGRLAGLATSIRTLPATASSEIAPGATIAWLAELALRLASHPAKAEVWAGARLREGLTRLLEAPTLARAARFLVLGTDRHLHSRTTPDELYAGWGWR